MVNEQLLVELTAHLKRTGGGNSLLHASVAVIKEQKPWMLDSTASIIAGDLRKAFLDQVAEAANKLDPDRGGDLLTRYTEFDRAWEALQFYGLRHHEELRREVKKVVERARELKAGVRKMPLSPKPSPIEHGYTARQALRKARDSEAARVRRVANKMVADPKGNLPPPGTGWQHN